MRVDEHARSTCYAIGEQVVGSGTLELHLTQRGPRPLITIVAGGETGPVPGRVEHLETFVRFPDEQRSDGTILPRFGGLEKRFRAACLLDAERDTHGGIVEVEHPIAIDTACSG